MVVPVREFLYLLWSWDSLNQIESMSSNTVLLSLPMRILNKRKLNKKEKRVYRVFFSLKDPKANSLYN